MHGAIPSKPAVVEEDIQSEGDAPGHRSGAWNQPRHENAQPNLQQLTVPLRLWPAILLTGAGAGLAGGLLMKLLRLVQHFCFNYKNGDFLSGVQGVSGVHRAVVVGCAGMITAIGILLIRRLPDAGGPGLTEAIWKRNGELRRMEMIGKALLSIVIVGMGAALGREAALKQAGGVIGSKFAEWTRFTPEQRRMLVACGAGAGMAAAYNVPFGGALFILEALLGTASFAAAVPAFAASFLATAVSWLLLPNEPTYLIPYLPATRSLLIWAMICGPLMGLCAIAFVRGIHWAESHRPRGAATVLMPLLVFAALGCAAMYFPALLGNGKNVVQLALEAKMTGGLLLLMVVMRPLATMACLRAGAPGGLFTPTMTFGSLLGAALGEGWSHVYPGADSRSCALIGAGSVLAAATQAPISSVAFIVELTYNTNTLMLPLLLAVVGACVTYHRFESRTSY